MKEPNQELIEKARELFAQMVQEEDIDKRRDLKIEINDICLRGKFDYQNMVYNPMAKQLRPAE